MSNKNGYSYKNYLIESGSKAVTRAAYSSLAIASMGQLVFWVNVLSIWPEPDYIGIVAMSSSSFIFWIVSWWLAFSRMIIYVHWLSWYGEYDDDDTPTPVNTAPIMRVYQSKENGYTLDR